MKGQTIGKVMDYGYAGSYARQPDMIISSRMLGGTANVAFGAVLVYDTDGNVVQFSATNVATDFVGVASRRVKSATDYLNQSTGQYVPAEAVPVFKRGNINVLCNVGTPTFDSPAYIRIAENASIPTGVVGGFEAAADGTNTIQLTNCSWVGSKDSNNIAELCIKTINRA